MMIERVTALCQRITSLRTSTRLNTSLRNATRLWNWIDHQKNPERLWAVMLIEIPWVFRDATSPNTMRFTY